ncbi:MFS transporter [Pseudonocardia phyllosphaerae]|uniref:MFS transporter n=1 Tax=Pseudonocardia phyllosphaerae TaxID=3390502 RepID=UPI00397BBA26
MLAIPAFRRLWTVTALTSTGEWLSLLALTSLATHLTATAGFTAQSFALGGVVATKLVPSLLCGPLAGVLADRFDRRRVMIVCDLAKFVLLASVPFVHSLWWLLVVTLLLELCTMFWIPAKDAAVPNLLRRPEQMEQAAQLSLVVTYGVAVVGGAGLFALVAKAAPLLDAADPTAAVHVALFLNSFVFLASALVVALRIPELSGRAAVADRREVPPSMLFLLRDGFRFVAGTPLVRGLVIGIVGAFTAGGAVIATAKLYASGLGGGDAAYSVLFASVFAGLALGMLAAPRLAQRLPHQRLFGAAIVGAGLALVLVAVAVHLFMAIAAVVLVGGFAGVAFLTGLTIIGTRVADEVRGRVNAFVQSLVRLVLLGAMSLVPVVVGVIATRTVMIGGAAVVVDGTRFVLAGGGILAAAVGAIAYRLMSGADAVEPTGPVRVEEIP